MARSFHQNDPPLRSFSLVDFPVLPILPSHFTCFHGPFSKRRKKENPVNNPSPHLSFGQHLFFVQFTPAVLSPEKIFLFPFTPQLNKNKSFCFSYRLFFSNSCEGCFNASESKKKQDLLPRCSKQMLHLPLVGAF